MRKLLFVIALCGSLAGCSSSSPQGKASPLPPVPQQAIASGNNPAAKYLELVGFRIREKGPGTLEVRFGVVNHSEADLGDLSLIVFLQTTSAKPGDPPVCSFPVKVASLGPEEMKEVSALTPSKLRVYELPDWQFLRPEFQISEPK